MRLKPFLREHGLANNSPPQPLLNVPELQFRQPGIQGIASGEFLVRPDGLDPAVIHDHDAVDLLDAGGFDPVIIETVGVGQDEVDIVRVADTTVVVSAPGLGDDIQAIKAGVKLGSRGEQCWRKNSPKLPCTRITRPSASQSAARSSPWVNR